MPKSYDFFTNDILEIAFIAHNLLREMIMTYLNFFSRIIVQWNYMSQMFFVTILPPCLSSHDWVYGIWQFNRSHPVKWFLNVDKTQVKLSTMKSILFENNGQFSIWGNIFECIWTNNKTNITWTGNILKFMQITIRSVCVVCIG